MPYSDIEIIVFNSCTRRIKGIKKKFCIDLCEGGGGGGGGGKKGKKGSFTRRDLQPSTCQQLTSWTSLKKARIPSSFRASCNSNNLAPPGVTYADTSCSL